jgi:anti-sigma factor RsiW
MLQSYFDGELSTKVMEKATLHLASCIPCAAAARELEQETSLLEEAFAAEFESAVPTERLRMKIDAAVAGLHVVPTVAQPSRVAGFFASLGSLFTLSPQRTLGYASLVAVLAFAAIFGVLKMNAPESPVAKDTVRAPVQDKTTPGADSVASSGGVTAPPVNVSSPESTPAKQSTSQRPRVVRPVQNKGTVPVQLLPGEKSYLKTIARLDSTIKAQTAMRPSLQVEYERNLAVVDRAIAATRSAAKSNPNDPDAADFMFAAYQSKVDLLNTIADSRLGGRSH